MKNQPDHNDNHTPPDFAIDLDGQWYHNGAPIQRKELARLFSDRALKQDAEGHYWLQTPFEKYAVDVADVPYIIVDFKAEGDEIIFLSNMDEKITLGEDHPLELKYCKAYDMKLPYIPVRDGLYARLGRNIYYTLVEKYGLALESGGVTYPLGELNDDA